jgi:Myb/SANT-like DNA-binding domain
MIQVLFTELLEQAQDGKRADSGFKKEAWDSVLREVQLVYTGSYPIPLQKIKQKEQAYKALYKDWRFLRDQSGFGWDEETQMITAPNEVWDEIIKVS